MQLIRNFQSRINSKSRVLISVMRDENILLEYFINYYKHCGITHFIIVDNGSEDGGFEYLLSLDANLMLFRTTDSYKDSNFGVDWVNSILYRHCRNVWCLVVDADELVFTNNLNVLIKNMEKENSTICRFLLLDMYSKDINKYRRGNHFLSHSNYFDKYSKKYYHSHKYGYKGTYSINGGIRQRMLSISPCLMKRSLFFNNFKNIKLSCGFHWIRSFENKHVTSQQLEQNNVKYYSRLEYLLHFKFIKPNFQAFVKRRIENNQDWDNSEEYKNYSKLNLNELYDEEYSVKIQSKSQLDSIFKDLMLIKDKSSIDKNQSVTAMREKRRTRGGQNQRHHLPFALFHQQRSGRVQHSVPKQFFPPLVQRQPRGHFRRNFKTFQFLK